MQVTQKQMTSIEAMADRVLHSPIGCLFQSREIRDDVARFLKEERGVTTRKGSSRNQCLHPEYVLDYEGTLETGFGNTQYQTHWPVLYRLTVGR